MDIQIEKKKNTCVFFARDFLATEFSKFGKSLYRYRRVYVVSNDNEVKIVKQHDSEAYIYSIKNVLCKVKDNVKHNQIEVSFNKDRFLRYYDGQKINKIITAISFIFSDITSKFNVKYYFDEPVSGFINDYFNRNFRNIGTVCLHFHFAWIPNYIFFTQDEAQREPVEVSSLTDMTKVVAEHVSNRQKDKERPRYVIGYESRIRVLFDAFSMLAKGIYRKIFRHRELYLDADPAPHFFHAQCLLKSFYFSYGSLPLIDDQSRYVVLPLHYEPEAVISYFSRHRRQVELAEQLIDTLPYDFKLVIKEHPSQPGALAMPQWRNVTKCARVIPLRAHSDIKELFARQIYVVSIGSTFALEAAMHGKPVAVLGGAHFVGVPNVIEIKRPEEWLQLLELEVNPSSNALIEWYSAFMARYCVKGSIMRGHTNMSMVSYYIES